jgi:hypothetical protein
MSYIHRIFSKNVLLRGKINSMSHCTSELSRESCLDLSNLQVRITAHILREVSVLANLKLVSNSTFFIFKTFTHNQSIIWSYTRTDVNNVTERVSLKTHEATSAMITSVNTPQCLGAFLDPKFSDSRSLEAGAELPRG